MEELIDEEIEGLIDELKDRDIDGLMEEDSDPEGDMLGDIEGDLDGEILELIDGENEDMSSSNLNLSTPPSSRVLEPLSSSTIDIYLRLAKSLSVHSGTGQNFSTNQLIGWIAFSHLFLKSKSATLFLTLS